MKSMIIPLLLVLTVSCEMLTDCPEMVKGKPEKSEYPVAIVNDSNQLVMYYNNGVIF